jgi:hypothetical protein
VVTLRPVKKAFTVAIMWRLPLIAAVCWALAISVGCADVSQGVMESADPSRKVVNLATCNCEIISKTELAQLRKQAESGRHHYVLRPEGPEVWRFDEGTGEICLLLAPKWSAEENAQACRLPPTS